MTMVSILNIRMCPKYVRMQISSEFSLQDIADNLVNREKLRIINNKFTEERTVSLNNRRKTKSIMCRLAGQ